MPARPAGCYRLRQRAGSADLDHMIDTASVRQILCLLAPVRHGLVIDDGVGPETLELFQLLLGGRRSDYSGARSFRELQREQRYTTRAKDQHRITGLHLAAHHQASPGGDSRAGERCRLHMRVACRCLREGVRRHAHVLAGIAVDTFSRYVPLGRGRHFASQPIGPKRADDGICDLELIDIVPDRNHFSSAIGHRNAAVGARYFPEHHHIVMEIQRAGPDPDQQFTRPWFGMIFLDQFEIFQASRRSQPNQPHEYLL